jgi:hypothetical protein
MEKVQTTGYKYGIWLVPKTNTHEIFYSMQHLPHITCICNIPTRKEAIQFYQELISLDGMSQTQIITLKSRGVDLGFVQYQSSEKIDAHKEYCWGYNVIWDHSLSKRLRQVQQKTNIAGDIPETPHLTIKYTNIPNNIEPVHLVKDIMLECKVVVTDITSTSPEDWHIIQNDLLREDVSLNL